MVGWGGRLRLDGSGMASRRRDLRAGRIAEEREAFVVGRRSLDGGADGVGRRVGWRRPSWRRDLHAGEDRGGEGAEPIGRLGWRRG
jgi:hypothetical protein